jgi:uncharacterized protein (TIGR03437 family)
MTTNLRLEYIGTTMNLPNVTVQAADPALFRLHYGYSDLAAVLNQDGTVNGPSNPARGGSIISVFGIGFGVSGTPGVTGAVTPLAASSYLANVSVGGAPVQYAGVAPGLLEGVGQINFVVPNVSGEQVVPLAPSIAFPNGVQNGSVQSVIYVLQ